MLWRRGEIGAGGCGDRLPVETGQAGDEIEMLAASEVWGVVLAGKGGDPDVGPPKSS